MKKYIRKYTEEQREAARERTRIYRENNKDKIQAYREANKDEIAKYLKNKYDSGKLNNLYIVYCLPNTENIYCGYTQNPKERMKRHRTAGRNTSEWFVLQVCETRDEALRVEAEYHKLGYGGDVNARFKQAS